MTDEEFTKISPQRLFSLADPRVEPFDVSCLPQASAILEEVFQEGGEVFRAKQDSQYIGRTEQELTSEIPQLINACVSEMSSYETTARIPAVERLENLKKIAATIKWVIVFSAPGDYKRLNKPDRYKDDPAMLGEDRRRSDQAAILAIVLAGIKAGWPDSELLLFLNQHVLPAKSDELYKLREKARRTLKDSGIRLVYTGRDDEISAVRRALERDRAFVPKDCVDILGPEGGDTTIGQTKLLEKYLADNLKTGDDVIFPINIQGIRAMRMAKASAMIPRSTQAYIFAMATSTKPEATAYRRREVRGTVFYALTKRAAFDPAPHKII